MSHNRIGVISDDASVSDFLCIWEFCSWNGHNNCLIRTNMFWIKHVDVAQQDSFLPMMPTCVSSDDGSVAYIHVSGKVVLQPGDNSCLITTNVNWTKHISWNDVLLRCDYSCFISTNIDDAYFADVHVCGNNDLLQIPMSANDIIVFSRIEHKVGILFRTTRRITLNAFF